MTSFPANQRRVSISWAGNKKKEERARNRLIDGESALVCVTLVRSGRFDVSRYADEPPSSWFSITQHGWVSSNHGFRIDDGDDFPSLGTGASSAECIVIGRVSFLCICVLVSYGRLMCDLPGR